MAEAAQLATGWRCPTCGREERESQLVCQSCHGLRYREQLSRLASEAQQREAAGDLSAALGQWRQALDLLPPESRQYGQVQARVKALSLEVDGARDPTAPGQRIGSGRPQNRTGIAAIGATVLALLSKLKFLALGLTKLSTLGSMLLFFGVYWTLYGWQFGAGLVASIYIHEMGHVAALRQFGIAASAPMFIPGLGALVRLKQYPTDAREDARVGLAGPWWGLGAAAVALAAGMAFDSPVLLAIAHTGAFINLFNLIPVWQLDGSRGLRPLSRVERRLLALVVAVAWFVTSESMLFLLLLGLGFRLFEKKQPETGDRRTLVEFVLLIAALSAIIALKGGGLEALRPPLAR